MLRIIVVKPLVKNLGPISENNIIDGVSGGSKITGAKLWVNFQAKWSKSKNTITPNFLTKSKLLTKPSSEPGFLTLRARSAFAKLR